MSRRHAGNFRAKHPPGTIVDNTIMAAVASRMKNQSITCKKAFSIARELSVSPLTVGKAIDLQEGRITGCQLGLFGYGNGQKPAGIPFDVPDALEFEIRKLLENGRLSCEKAWLTAESENLSRLNIAQACESLGIRIGPCQLGAF